MAVERFVLGKGDLQHLLEGGTLVSPEGTTELALADLGVKGIYSTMKQAMYTVTFGESRLRERRVVSGS